MPEIQKVMRHIIFPRTAVCLCRNNLWLDSYTKLFSRDIPCL